MRRLVFVSVLLLAACGDKQEFSQSSQQARQELDTGKLDPAEALLQQAYDQNDQLSRQHLAQRAFDLAEAGDLYVANGDTPAALKSYQDSHELVKKLVELEPKQAEWQHDLSLSYNKIGDLYQSNGDTPAALKSYCLLYTSRCV